MRLKVIQQYTKQMYQNIKENKIEQQMQKKYSINSVRLIDFNLQWTHPYQEQFLKGKTKKNDLQGNKSDYSKLKTLKLPEIKQSSRENCIIKPVNPQKLNQINIAQRIKNVQSSSQDQENLLLNSQQILKYKVEEIRKLNNKLRKTINVTEIQPGNVSFSSNRNIYQRKFAKTRQEEAKSINTIPLKAKISIASPEDIEQECQKSTLLQTQRQVNNTKKQEQQQQKIQIYDKKMKIGRKKKKEEDRIRAMLLKTLQKTKGTDYVAQQGSSQTKTSPRSSRLTNPHRSRQTQNPNLILVDPTSNQPILKLSSIRKSSTQKLKSSLLPIKSTRPPQQQQCSNYVKNKKFVQMVRKIENRKKFFQQQLQEIKQQRTISHQDDNNQFDDYQRLTKNHSLANKVDGN